MKTLQRGFAEPRSGQNVMTSRWGFGLAAMCLASLVFGVGCVEEKLTAMYAREFNCPKGDIKIGVIGDGRYRVQGCDRTVMYECIGSANCIPMSSSLDRNAESQPAPAQAQPASANQSPASTNVEQARVDKNKKGATLVMLDARLDDKSLLKLRGLPEAKHDLQLKIALTHQSQSLENCSVSLMINGSRMDLPKGKFERDGDTQTLRMDAAPELLHELAVTHKFAMKACDFRWALAPESTAEIRHFAELYQQELAWAAPANSRGTGGLIAPADGWPPWGPPALVAFADAGAPLEGPALFKLLAPSVFRIVVNRSDAIAEGSAVAISKTQLLTNCHVLQSGQKITVLQGKQELPASISAADPASDRCVLNVTNANFTPIHGLRAQSSLQVGEALYTLGSPNGLELTLSNGILSGVRDEDGETYVQTSAPISPGSSGGGLFDARGNLVGITTAVLVGHEHMNQSLNFAIPAEAFGKP